jgi:hypothetical protein
MFNHDFVIPPVMTKVTAEDGKRFYTTPEGKSYESVTTFLSRSFKKPGLVKWRKKVGEKEANRIRDNAQVRGNFIHDTIEHYLRNEQIPWDDNTNPNFKSLFIKMKPILNRMNNIRLLEAAIYSDELELAGSPDYCGDFDNEVAIVDFKTNNWADKKKIDALDYFIQCAAYSKMMKERFNIIPVKAVIIIASPNAPCPVVFEESMSICERIFDRFRADPEAFQRKVAQG